MARERGGDGRPAGRDTGDAGGLARPPETVVDVSVVPGRELAMRLPGDWRSWSGLGAEFARRHGAWWEHHSDDGPVYCLPEPVVTALTRSAASLDRGHRASPALISPSDGAAEHAFREL